MSRIVTAIFTVLSLCQLPEVSSWTTKDETSLRTNLSSGYDRFVRPSTPTNVFMYYNIRSLLNLDISQQKMSLTGWLSMFWNDSRLQWNDSANDITSLEMDWSWRPEFLVSNSASDLVHHGYDNTRTRVRATHQGLISWNYPLASTTSCEVDISDFPFDTQTCDLETIFWGSREYQVNIKSLYEVVMADVYLSNAEWELDATFVVTEIVPLCCPYEYTPLVRHRLTFTRRKPYYIMNLIVPTVLLSVCMVLTFLLPTESGERLGFSLTVLLSYTVQLSIIAQLMPTTSEQVPHIAEYLMVILVMCSVVICNVVVHVKIFNMEGDVGQWIQIFYRKSYPIVFLRCWSVRKKTNTAGNYRVSHEDECEKDTLDVEMQEQAQPDNNMALEDKEKVTWARVSILMDRIAFYIYLVAVSVVNGSFLNSIS